MPVIEVLLEVPRAIARGLASGELERVGSVIRDPASKKIVAWLREGGKLQNNPDPASALPRFLFQSLLKEANSGDTAQKVVAIAKLAGSVDVVANVMGFANFAATARSHYLITLRLQAIQNMLALSTGLGLLNFTLSGTGLLVMLKRFADIERLLEKVYDQVSKAVSKQADREHQINLRAALEAAQVVMEAENGNFKESMAANLDFLLINAREHCIRDFHDKRYRNEDKDFELAQNRLAQAMHIDETRVRAFLEVGQYDLANSVMQQRLKQYRKETRNFIGILLGRHHKRAVYFHAKVDDTDLRRYLLIEQWLRDEEDILWDILLERRKQFWDDHIKDALEPKPGIQLPGIQAPEPPTQHLDALTQAESAIENFQRFDGFALELESLSQLGITLKEWEALHNTDNTVFVKAAEVDVEDHDDYVLLVESDYLNSVSRPSD